MDDVGFFAKLVSPQEILHETLINWAGNALYDLLVKVGFGRIIYVVFLDIITK